MRSWRKIPLLNWKHLPVIGVFIAGLCLSFLFAACSSSTVKETPNNTTTNSAKLVRIGYQKSLILLKAKGVLEKRLNPERISVEWIEFPAGPQLLEAMSVGSVDFGHAGESPPIFAQAAGNPLVYIAGIAPSPAGSALLVPEKSPIQNISELKGKKIAVQKGSSAHYLLVQILNQAGLKYSDIQPVFLPPADARAAFIKGSVDAWVIWDPFYAAAEKSTNTRVLIDGQSITKQGGYYLASRKFAQENQPTIKAIIEEIQKLEEWSNQNRDEVAQVLASTLGIDLEAMKKATNRRKFGVVGIDQALIAEQQKVADTYFELKLIPKQIKVQEAMLTPEQYATLLPQN